MASGAALSSLASAHSTLQPRYPEHMRADMDLAAREAMIAGDLAEAAFCLAKRELAGLFTHCSIIPIAAEDHHLCAITARIPRTGSYPVFFIWTKRYPDSILGETDTILTYQFGTDCPNHQYKYSFRLAPYHGVVDEGVNDI